MEYVAFDYNEPTNQCWKEIMTEKLKTASTFEIHCWTEETEEITMALPFGTFKESKVTPEFTSFLLGLPKPTDTEIYNKMTPFFTIVLDNGFWSEHYGTELDGI